MLFKILFSNQLIALNICVRMDISFSTYLKSFISYKIGSYYYTIKKSLNLNVLNTSTSRILII